MNRTFIAFCLCVVWLVLGCVTLGVVNAHDAHRHKVPDMSRCDLVTSKDHREAWYQCPYSMGE